MASSLKISYAQIPFNSVSITPSVAADTNNNEWNLVAGPRYQRFFYGSAATSRSTVYDIGTTYASKDSTVDHLLVARADFLQDDGTTDIVLASSPDNATWTNRIGISDLNTETLTGPRANDIVVTGGPPVLGNCTLWLDATKGVTKDASNQVSQWNDQSGNGNHVTQATSTNQPLATGSGNLENLRTYSEDCTNAAWNVAAYPVTMTGNTTTDPFGTTLADTMTATAGTSRHGTENTGYTFTRLAGSSYTISVYVKKGNYQYLWIGDGRDSAWHGVSVDLDAGTIQGGNSYTSATIEALSNSWYRVSLTYTTTATGSIGGGVWFNTNGNLTSPSSFTAAGTETVYLYGLQHRRATTNETYVATTSLPVLPGVNGLPSIDFDGNDNYLSANGLAATFTGDDKPFTLMMAFKKTTNAGSDVLFSFANSGSATPSCQLYTDASADFGIYRRDDASGSATQAAGAPDTTTTVLSGVFSGTTISCWINGSNIINAASLNTGTAAFNTCTIGANVSTTTTNYANMQVCEVALFDSALGTTDRQTIEAYLTAKWITSPSTTQILESPQARYWRVTYSGSSQVYRHSKCYFGKFFTFDYDPTYEIDFIPAKDSVWYASSGAAHFVRPGDPIYRITLTATAMSDTNVKSFEDKIARYAHRTPVFLHDIKVPEVLNNVSPIHAWLVDYSVEKVAYNYNQMTMVFEEALG